jgi:hypothetical protein
MHLTGRSYRTYLFLGVIAVSGCTTKSDDLVVQSKFAYSNGDYTYMGHVEATKKYTTSSFNVPEMTAEVFHQLEQQALTHQSGADFIVNYLISSSVTSVPLIPISWTTFRLDGTAVKGLKVGQQNYSDQGIPSPTRTR